MSPVSEQTVHIADELNAQSWQTSFLMIVKGMSNIMDVVIQILRYMSSGGSVAWVNKETSF